MHFDDRLDTVLSQPAAGRTMQRIQFRQLLDLLGTAPAGLVSDRLDAAHARFAELGRSIPAGDRAAMLGDPGLRLRNPQLLAQLLAEAPPVAAAAATKAELSDEQWADLIPILPVRLRSLIRQRRELSAATLALLDKLGVPGRALPAGSGAAASAAAPAAPTAPVTDEPSAPESIEEIGAIVRRIEAYRKTRLQNDQEQEAAASADSLPEVSRTPLTRFDFATDAGGRIVSADRSCAPSVVGLRIAAEDPDAPLQSSPGMIAAFAQHQPMRNETASIDGAPWVAGGWRVDAMPCFDRHSGGFTGYIGRMRRPAEAPAAAPAPRADHDGDRVRQMLHELRTPVNAIQGFAEVLLYQLYGPTPHEYRALAASIAGDGARILAGFDELERLVKLDCDALQLEPGESDLAALVTGALGQLTSAMAARGSGFTSSIEADSLPVAMARVDAERLVWRLLAALANWAAPGEMLKLRLRERDGEARLSIRLPDSLAGQPDARLFDAATVSEPQALSAGMFGTGFALRLAAAEARAAGGVLERRGDKLRLTVPGLTRHSVGHSQAGGAPL